MLQKSNSFTHAELVNCYLIFTAERYQCPLQSLGRPHLPAQRWVWGEQLCHQILTVQPALPAAALLSLSLESAPAARPGAPEGCGRAATTETPQVQLPDLDTCPLG